MDKSTQAEVVDALEAMIAEVAPDLFARAMYGGIILEREPGIAATSVGGYFTYRAHVSFEFSQGAQLHDPGKHLEGKGKARRHIKLRTLCDVSRKEVAGFLAQAVALG
ncbi:uncharacterized protein DUF1801 [Shimia isoporae]|uniref:Uncharacterized protein DUF1801 n=1 Tax=Shimia isoporae TaxID=647720 RepID=A0A4V2Q216_9RHOB|nr:DUF1801 domain-containing protein [Shimia isoporae]TCL00424.1 uncharacterized protein DUF1801 [Shimia isoporae]